MMMRSSSTLLLFCLAQLSSAQFSCTFSGATDESSCIQTENGSDHCVWCDLGGTTSTASAGFGVCVSESQAETIEQSVPVAHCDRYSDGDDDTTPKTDDDYNMPDDDKAPSDDTIPSDYWECLKKADPKSCTGDCTWCDTPVGYGVCMSGPSAEAAKTSSWYTCADDSSASAKETAVLQDPLDPSCMVAFLQDQSPESCSAAVDADGNPCEFCTLQGAFQLCLNAEQAAMGEQFGVTCNDKSVTAIQDPTDPSCMVAFLQDQSPDACNAAVDADGNPCEFCTLQGAFQLCLNEEQAEMGEAFGVTCGGDEDSSSATAASAGDPMDPSCLVAFLQDQSPESCAAAVDADGNPCEFCTLQGAFQLCLNAEQAEMGESFGVTCGDNDTTTAAASPAVQDPTDPSCMIAFLQDQSPESCAAAVDADGNPCEFCTLQGAFQLCLNEEQAEMGEAFGVTCGDDNISAIASPPAVEDPTDPSCMIAFLQDQSPESCAAAVDADGNPCEFCTLQGAFQLCLNEEQAEMGEAFGVTCNEDLLITAEQTPFDELSECLEHYQEDDCFHSSCTWCNTQVGMGFCLTTGFATITKNWSFFDCEFASSAAAMA